MEPSPHSQDVPALTGRNERTMVPAMGEGPTSYSHPLFVEMFPGHKGEPTPRAFTHDGIRVEVRQIIGHWETVQHSVFQVAASDGHRYTLRCHLDDLKWELVMQQES